MKIDWSLYLVTDRDLAAGRPLPEIVAEAVSGGVTVVQLREKNCDTRDFISLAREINRILQPHGIPLIINDRADVALAAGCAGLHIGQSDMTYQDARRLMGPDAIIGLSVENLHQAREAEALDVDYLGVSPIFTTPTKQELTHAWGMEGLRQLRAQSGHVLIAIGGIQAGNTADIIRAGADGVAVVSGIIASSDPAQAAQEYRRAIAAGRHAPDKK